MQDEKSLFFFYKQKNLKPGWALCTKLCKLPNEIIQNNKYKQNKTKHQQQNKTKQNKTKHKQQTKKYLEKDGSHKHVDNERHGTNRRQQGDGRKSKRDLTTNQVPSIWDREGSARNTPTKTLIPSPK